MGIRRMTTGKGMTMDKRFSAVSTDVAYPMTIGPIGLADCGLADWPDQEGRDVLDVLRVGETYELGAWLVTRIENGASLRIESGAGVTFSDLESFLLANCDDDETRELVAALAVGASVLLGCGAFDAVTVTRIW